MENPDLQLRSRRAAPQLTDEQMERRGRTGWPSTRP
jgi:hypothetical protein